MADKKKRKKFKEEVDESNSWKPTQEEEEIAKYLHRKLPSIEGRLSGAYVNVFNAEEAIDLLLISPWAKPELDTKKQRVKIFTTRASVIAFLQSLMDKRMFQKAIIVKKPKESKKLKTKTKKADEVSKISSGKLSNETNNISKEVADSKCIDDSSETAKVLKNGPSKEKLDPCKKNGLTSKKPLRLEIVSEQIFTVSESGSGPCMGSGNGTSIGSNTGDQFCYVWLYEPPPGLFNWLAGAGLLLGIILCCLFPLWPPQLRLLAYYLLLLASGLLGLILLTALVRALVFAFVFLTTLGRRRFWLLPNFFADCGFWDSFKPAWSCIVVTPSSSGDSVKPVVGVEKPRSGVSGIGVKRQSEKKIE